MVSIIRKVEVKQKSIVKLFLKCLFSSHDAFVIDLAVNTYICRI